MTQFYTHSSGNEWSLEAYFGGQLYTSTYKKCARAHLISNYIRACADSKGNNGWCAI